MKGSDAQETEVYVQLTDIFRSVFSNPSMVLTPSFTAREVQGWDSFRQVEIIIAVQEKYGFKFESHEIDAFRNVGDLAQAILGKTVT